MIPGAPSAPSARPMRRAYVRYAQWPGTRAYKGAERRRRPGAELPTFRAAIGILRDRRRHHLTARVATAPGSIDFRRVREIGLDHSEKCFGLAECAPTDAMTTKSHCVPADAGTSPLTLISGISCRLRLQ